MTGKMKGWPVNSQIGSDIVRWPTVISSPVLTLLSFQTTQTLQPSKIRNLYKEIVSSLSYEKFYHENFNTALCGDNENSSFKSHHKNKILVFVILGLFSLFCSWNNIHLVDIHGTHVNDIRLFQNRIPFWQGKRQRKSLSSLASTIV